MKITISSLIIPLLFASFEAMSAAVPQFDSISTRLLQHLDTPANSTSGLKMPALFPDTSAKNIDTKYQAALARLKPQADLLEKYIREHNYNTEYCFLVDMSIPSGKNRFFVYNIKKDSIELSSLVTHGYRSYEYNCNDQLQFSNMPYSFKTSLGKYKIGSSYYGHYGQAFKLYGLDSTNDKAYEREIVIHAHKNVPNAETYPERIMESLGCPAVSPSVLAKLDKYIKASKKPILMWVYN